MKTLNVLAASAILKISSGNIRGSLIMLETPREIPFAIARVYYIFGTQPEVVARIARP